jgi:hypothetical protein
MRDNPVHIAAREMSNRFEEKYRVMMSQLGSSNVKSDYDATFGYPVSGTGGSKKSKKSLGTEKRTSLGPAVIEQPVVAAPVDGNMHAIMDDLNRKIKEMQSEITQLRSVVKADAKPQSKKNLLSEPLTLEEKKALISRIHRLPPDRMARVVDIIQSAMPPSDRDDSDEVEIPLDELDTKTLRKLQDFVQVIIFLFLYCITIIIYWNRMSLWLNQQHQNEKDNHKCRIQLNPQKFQNLKLLNNNL